MKAHPSKGDKVRVKDRKRALRVFRIRTVQTGPEQQQRVADLMPKRAMTRILNMRGKDDRETAARLEIRETIPVADLEHFRGHTWVQRSEQIGMFSPGGGSE